MTALPPISDCKGIYGGKFKDTSPSIRPAGKYTASGEDVLGCFKPEKRPPSPEVIKRFRNTFYPGPGKRTVFYGKAYDPHRQWAEDMRHGVNTLGSLSAGQMVNPSPKTRFDQTKINKQESLYDSHKKKPLGRCHDQNPAFPTGYPWSSRVYGVVTHRDGNAGELVNPPKSFTDVEDDSAASHDIYVFSHKDFDPGEQLTRKYKSQNFQASHQFGMPTPHDNTGSATYTSLKWVHDLQSEKVTPLVSNRLDNFRERSQHQLGKTLDPIKDTMKVGPDHTYGILVKPDQYGAGDLLHRRGQHSYLRGQDHMRGVVAALRHHLKKANYQNFDTLKEAFTFYDKTGSGKIDMKSLATVCYQFKLPVEPELIAQVMDYCDVNRDGMIDYSEFAAFLNYNMDTETLRWTDPEGRESNSRMGKQIDEAIGSHRTSSSMISATANGPSTKGWRSYGIPTVRADLAAPKQKGIADTTNYGDEGGSYALLNPSIYTNAGLNEKDFLNPRPKEEIREIFTNIGVQMTLDTFDKIYNEASARHPEGKVSVESFRNILDEIQAEVIRESDAQLLSNVNC